MINVGILGATGIVGQQYIALLEKHPWFKISFLAASERSSGQNYENAILKKWRLETRPSERIRKMNVHSIDDLDTAKNSCQIVFSALPKEVAFIYEEKYAAKGLGVFSNASTHRTTPDVPLLIPEINDHHLSIIPLQKKLRGWTTGFIVVKPNCSIQSFMIPLDPLHRKFKIQQLHVTTMQAISGAGYPGLSSHDIFDNVIPFISGEEEKSETEPLKIWGDVQTNHIKSNTQIHISAHCNRVPVLHGHMACVSVKFAIKPQIEEIISTWNNYKSNIEGYNLPSSPKKVLLYSDLCDRPQTRLDREYENGMGVVVGRLRNCPLMDIRFVGLSHNTIRGAAGGGVLNAELLYIKKFI